MSFRFYDRVQSGQLISRANSDIRSVQMYLTFAPDDPRAVRDRGGRLRLHALHQRAPRLRRHGDDALRLPASACGCASRCSRCRGSSRPGWPTWPPSSTRTSTASGWCKSFAAEQQQLRTLAEAADQVQWGYIKDADLRARFTPRSRTCPRSAWPWSCSSAGYMVIHGQPRRRRHPGLQRLPAHAPGAVHDAGDADHDGPAGGRLGRADLRDPRRAADHRRPSRGRRSRRLRRRRRFDDVDFAYGPTVRHWCSPTSTCTSAPGRPSPWSGGRRAASRPWPACCRASTTSTDGSVRIDGHDVRDLTHREPAGQRSASSSTSRSCSRCRSGTTSPTAGPTPRSRRCEAAAEAAGADEFITPAARRLRHGGRRAGLHAVGRPAPAHRHRPHAAGQPAHPGPRRRHQRHRRPGRAGDPRRACGS